MGRFGLADVPTFLCHHVKLWYADYTPACFIHYPETLTYKETEMLF